MKQEICGEPAPTTPKNARGEKATPNVQSKTGRPPSQQNRTPITFQNFRTYWRCGAFGGGIPGNEGIAASELFCKQYINLGKKFRVLGIWGATAFLDCANTPLTSDNQRPPPEVTKPGLGKEHSATQKQSQGDAKIQDPLFRETLSEIFFGVPG